MMASSAPSKGVRRLQSAVEKLVGKTTKKAAVDGAEAEHDGDVHIDGEQDGVGSGEALGTEDRDTEDLLVAADAMRLVGKSGRVLRGYQIAGVNWILHVLRRGVGSGGMLADEMGLGKTIQTVAALSALKEQALKEQGSQGQSSHVSFLVLAPLSVLNDWSKEMAAHSTVLSCVVYTGDKDQREVLRKRLRKDRASWDCVITSYEVVNRDVEFFVAMGAWDCLVVDEAHRLKNDQGLLYTNLNDIEFAHRILLTGTPVQNNLAELYALLAFAQPSVFTERRREEFLAQFGTTRMVRENNALLQSIIRPFLLRRTKGEVLDSDALPDKREASLLCGLSTTQQRLYKALLLKDAKLFGSAAGTRTSFMNLLVELRKCANHPYLFDGIEPEPFECGEHLVTASGKLVVLDQLLQHLINHGHRALVFSQMTRMLDIVQDYLDLREFSYERLDGSVRGEERYAAIDAFNAGSDGKSQRSAAAPCPCSSAHLPYLALRCLAAAVVTVPATLSCRTI